MGFRHALAPLAVASSVYRYGLSLDEIYVFTTVMLGDVCKIGKGMQNAEKMIE